MRYTKAMQALAAAFVLFFGMNVLAAQKDNQTRMTVLAPVMVNGTTLAPGDYTVTWNGSSGDVQVTILRGKKVMATVPAKLEPGSVVYGNTAYVTKQDGSGLQLVEIRPRGSKDVLALSGAGSAMGQQ